MSGILDDDYFQAEAGIGQLLRTEFGDEVKYASPGSLGELKEQSQGTVNLYVVYAGDVDAGGTDDGGSQQIDQQWLVVLSVRNPAAQLDSSKSRAMAGPYVSRLLKCLMGQSPGRFCGPLKRGGGQSAGYSTAFAYFPFLFTTRIVTSI